MIEKRAMSEKSELVDRLSRAERHLEIVRAFFEGATIMGEWDEVDAYRRFVNEAMSHISHVKCALYSSSDLIPKNMNPSEKRL